MEQFLFLGKIGVIKCIFECKPCSWRFYNPPAYTCMTMIIFPTFFSLSRWSSIQNQGSVAPFGHEALPCRKFHGFPWPVCPVNHANGKFPTYSQGPSAILGLPTFIFGWTECSGFLGLTNQPTNHPHAKYKKIRRHRFREN